MASAAATEIEEHKGSFFITVGKKTLHVAIDFIVIHIIVVQHLIIDRPLIEEIVNNGFRHIFSSFRPRFCSFLHSREAKATPYTSPLGVKSAAGMTARITLLCFSVIRCR